jgi:hypothetical protein
MANIDGRFLEAMTEIGEEWGIKTLSVLEANVRKKKLRTTGQLLQSLDQETKKDLSKVVSSIAFAFQDYGRFKDMRRNIWDKQPPVEAILEWVKQKGVSSFGADPNPYKNEIKTSERRANEIAWGIARKYAKNKAFRSRPWFQKSFFGMLNALSEDLLEAAADFSTDELKNSIKNGLNIGGRLGNKFIKPV